ncbi:uncharacterized protein ISCGN_029564 [Ixodes scapularis]
MWMANKTVELWNSDCSESDVDFTREPGMDNPGASPGDSDLQQQSIRSRHITPAMSCPTSNMSLDARTAAVSVSMPPTHQSRQDSQSPGLRTPATSLASTPPTHQSCQDSRSPNVRTPAAALASKPPTKQSRQESQSPGLRTPAASLATKPPTHQSCQDSRSPGLRTPAAALASKPPTQQSRQESQSPGLRTPAASLASKPPTQQSCQDSQSLGLRTPAASLASKPPTHQSCQDSRFPGLPDVAAGQDSPDQVPPLEQSQGFQQQDRAHLIRFHLLNEVKASSFQVWQQDRDHRIRLHPLNKVKAFQLLNVAAGQSSPDKVPPIKQSQGFQEKTLRMLLWFLDEETASDTLKHGYCVQERDISVMYRSLSSGALDTRAPILTSKKYFSRGAWSKVTEFVKKKKNKACGFVPNMTLRMTIPSK